ncbi:MAG TPA: NADH-quinone oxidoreductase subunit NuoE [Bryobacteraceae bacterium]
MLTAEEQKEIDEELAHYPNKQAVAIDAMLIVQRHRGWVSDAAIRDIAQVLDMSEADLDGVATFYNLIRRKPVGRHVALICDSVSCWIMGCERVRDQLCTRLGTTLGGSTADGRFTLLPAVCLGACDHAPAMLVDSDLYTNVDEGKIDHILAAYE